MSRIDYFKQKPDLISKLRAITQEQKDFALEARLRAVIELRVSQINGCTYCIDLHDREARTLGEPPQRLDALPSWNQSALFHPREKAALGWAESLTLIHETHADEKAYRNVCNFFSDQEVAELSLAVSLANFWNRLAGGFHRMPDEAKTQPEPSPRSPARMALRSPFEPLANCVWLPRFIDKARMHENGLLTGDYLLAFCHPRGIDGYFLRHFALDKDNTLSALASRTDEREIAGWFLSQPAVTPKNIEDWNEFAPKIGRAGQPGERELKLMLRRTMGNTAVPDLYSAFEIILWDESPERQRESKP